MDFFAELKKLQLTNPREGLIQLKNVNCDYTHLTDQCKNCYLLANAVSNEDCMYGRDFYGNTDCVDCDHIRDCTLCYECLNCKNCYNSDYLQDCENSRDCSYGYYLRDCADCIGCVSLRKKSFHIFNKPYSKEEYARKMKTLTPETIREGFSELKKKNPHIATYQLSSDNCIGNYVFHSRNAYEAYDIVGCQDVGYILEAKGVTDSWDISVMEYSELCYEISSCHKMTNCNFCFYCVGSSNLEYCELAYNCHDCFGCIALHHKRYHILNTPYSKEDYFKKVAEIKWQLRREGTYGQRFLPSTYPLDDTVAVWPQM